MSDNLWMERLLLLLLLPSSCSPVLLLDESQSYALDDESLFGLFWYVVCLSLYTDGLLRDIAGTIFRHLPHGLKQLLNYSIALYLIKYAPISLDESISLIWKATIFINIDTNQNGLKHYWLSFPTVSQDRAAAEIRLWVLVSTRVQLINILVQTWDNRA